MEFRCKSTLLSALTLFNSSTAAWVFVFVCKGTLPNLLASSSPPLSCAVDQNENIIPRRRFWQGALLSFLAQIYSEESGFHKVVVF